MIRSLIIVATVSVGVFAVERPSANAEWRLFGGSRSQRRARVPNNYRTPYPTTTGRMSVGVFSYPNYGYPRPGSFDPYRFDNYVYDPYTSGSFRAPDLINDPYFRERHRYDSAFPGRYRTPLVMRPVVPDAIGPSNRYDASPRLTHPRMYQPRTLDPRMEPPRATRPYRNPSSAAQQLANSLAQREDGDAWLEFLAPDRVSQLIKTGNAAELSELLSHYDGIANNPEMKSIVQAPGFDETRSLLRRSVGEPEALPSPLNAEPISHSDAD